MKISLAPIVSDAIYLGEVSREFALKEGTVPREEQAWVKIRRAREGDRVAYGELQAVREVHYGSTFSESVGSNPRELAKYEAWWTIQEIGNLLGEDDEPLFGDGPASNMNFAEFDRIWSNLETYVSQAVLNAVWQVNSEWIQA